MANTKMNLVLLFSISLNYLLITSAQPVEKSFTAVASLTVHIVYTEKPPSNEDPKTYYIKILTPVLGSEEAARDALMYSFTSSSDGFAAKLTPEQVNVISKIPGVLNVVKSVNYELESKGSGGPL